jgi:hypothetical protein
MEGKWKRMKKGDERKGVCKGLEKERKKGTEFGPPIPKLMAASLVR